MRKLATLGHWAVLLAGRRRCWACSRLYLIAYRFDDGTDWSEVVAEIDGSEGGLL